MGCIPAKVSDSGVSADSEVNEIPHLKHKINLLSPITCMDISEDLSMLVLGTEDGVLHVFSTMSNPVESLAQLRGHSESITCCRLCGHSIFTGSTDCCIIKWSILTMRIIYVYRGHRSKINNILCAGKFLFSSAYDRTAKAWRISPADVDENCDEQRCAALSERLESSREFFDRDLLNVCTFRGHEKAVYPIAFIPADDNFNPSRDLRERDLLVTGSADCTARVWSTATADCRHILTGHTSPIHALAVDYEHENTIFTAGGDGLIMSFCSITGDRMRTMYGHEGAILRLDTHKNMLYSASVDRTVRAWVMEFGEDTRVLRGSRAPVTCVQYFGGFVICGSEDGSCRIYDSKSGSLMRTYGGHRSAIIDLRNVPGKVFTAQQDGFLFVWDSDGIKDETVFGDFEENISDESEADSSDVTEAVRILEKYLRQT